MVPPRHGHQNQGRTHSDLLMRLPRFRRPRLCPDVVGRGPCNRTSATGPRLAAAPFGVFSFKEQQRTLQTTGRGSLTPVAAPNASPNVSPNSPNSNQCVRIGRRGRQRSRGHRPQFSAFRFPLCQFQFFFCSRGSLTPVAAPNVSPSVFFWGQNHRMCRSDCGFG